MSPKEAPIYLLKMDESPGVGLDETPVKVTCLHHTWPIGQWVGRCMFSDLCGPLFFKITMWGTDWHLGKAHV